MDPNDFSPLAAHVPYILTLPEVESHAVVIVSLVDIDVDIIFGLFPLTTTQGTCVVAVVAASVFLTFIRIEASFPHCAYSASVIVKPLFAVAMLEIVVVLETPV